MEKEIISKRSRIAKLRKVEKEEEEEEVEKVEKKVEKEVEKVRWKLTSFFYSLVRNILESCHFE